MASFRTVSRMLSNTYLAERVYGAILCKLRAVRLDPQAPELQKRLAYVLFLERAPQQWIDAAMRAIAANPDLQDLVVVTETGSIAEGNLTARVNTEAITDEQIAAVVSLCWAALVEQQAAPQS